MSLVIAPEQVSEEAARLPINEIAEFLQQHLGQRMTAYLSGVTDPKMVSRWIAGRNMPRDEPQMRLREGYQVVRMLAGAYGDETAKAWLFGSNTRLDDQAPAYILRHSSNWEDLRFVVPAARTFAGSAG
ncbi:MAG TPA: XRE family transcriptional regulator [Actinomycetota bacterium]|nr:XRE family transcriptional regulator [Actinomycetota bacterium]